MRLMVIVKANKDSESGKLPEEQVLSELAKFEDQLVRAGVMVVAEGLAAGGPDEAGVAAHQRGERRLIAVAGEAPQQHGVGVVRAGGADISVELAQHRGELVGTHGRGLGGASVFTL